MGKLIEGTWLTDDKLIAFEEKQYKQAQGQFVRGTAKFRSRIGENDFQPEKNRYHLYAALNCPWAHRTLIFRSIMGLKDVIGLSLLEPKRTDQGWVFSSKNPDNLFNATALHQIYVKAAPNYTGRVTVPVLWDKKTKSIVSTESSEIIRDFNNCFNDITGNKTNFLPPTLLLEIDELNSFIYENINNRVYRTGFARTQEAYNENVEILFSALETLEKRLKTNQFLLGDTITEADWRLFPTLARFDVGYYSAFKCNIKALRDYPELTRFFKTLYHYPGVAETIDFDVYRKGYHSVSPLRNPHGIAPIGLSMKHITG